MVRNFEEQTHELNEYELKILLPAMIAGLKYRKGSEMAITSSKAMKKLKALGYKVSGPRWRKVINYIRINTIIPGLISTSKGYYIALKSEEVKDYMESLRERINSITSVYDSMEYQLHNYY